MKHQLLYIMLLAINFCFGQEKVMEDSATITIPKIDLKFRADNKSSSAFLSNSTKQIATTAGTDSIYVYQTKGNNAFLIMGNDTNFRQTNLSLPYSSSLEKDEISYRFYFDSLGTEQQYLIVNWYGRSYASHSTHSGSQELLCTETVNEYSRSETGMIIVSLASQQILFKGLTEIEKTETQKKNPGTYKKVLLNEQIQKVRFYQEESYLYLYNHGYENYSNWAHYDDLPFGIYQIIDDQFVLIHKK